MLVGSSKSELRTTCRSAHTCAQPDGLWKAIAYESPPSLAHVIRFSSSLMLKVTPGPAGRAATGEGVTAAAGTGERRSCGVWGVGRSLTWQHDAAQRPGGRLLLAAEDHQPLPVAIRHPHHGALPDRLPFGLVLAAHEHVHALRGELLLLLLLLRDHPHRAQRSERTLGGAGEGKPRNGAVAAYM